MTDDFVERRREVRERCTDARQTRLDLPPLRVTIIPRARRGAVDRVSHLWYTDRNSETSE